MADCRIVVLIGGHGSNLQALIDCPFPLHLVGVVSHREADGLKRAQQAKIPAQLIDYQHYGQVASFEKALLNAIHAFSPQLVVLAGFMRILSTDFIRHFPGQILNIHPSLLPRYAGLNTHQRVLAAGDQEHGATVHFVSEVVDSGPIVAQVKVPVLANDTPALLGQRVLQAEHRLYPLVVSWYAQDRLKCVENTVTLDNQRLGPHGIELSLTAVQGIVK